MLRRISEVLPELLIGILVWGLAVQFTGVWFVEDKLQYTTGLWIGIAVAMGMAIHISVSMRDALGLREEKSARNLIIFRSLVRYAVVVVTLIAVLYFQLGNIFTLILGVMGLKAGAYLWPLTHKLTLKCMGEEEEKPYDSEALDLEEEKEVKE